VAELDRLAGPVDQELAALKAAAGGDIVVTGSCQLVRSLAPLGLIDVYRLFVYPVVQGHGRRPFPGGFGTQLELTDSRRFPSGVVLMEYDTEG
jgi:dihydrofolate reductase